jgi:hypothetical protein
MVCVTMTRLLISLLLLTLFATPSDAQWQYEEVGGEARAFVIGQNGTSFGFRCTGRAEDRQSILLDMMVYPTTEDADDQDVAEFEVGSWIYNFETIRVERVGAMYRYQSRFGFYDETNQTIRGALKSGSVIRFTRTFDFAPMTFTLRGSRNAIERLEAACPRLWAGARAPESAPAAAGAWTLRTLSGRGVMAELSGSDISRLAVLCETGVGSNELVLRLSTRMRAEMVPWGDFQVTVRFDDRTVFLVSHERGPFMGASQDILFRLGMPRDAELIRLLARRGGVIEIPDQDVIGRARFEVTGGSVAIDQVLARCLSPSVPAPTAGALQSPGVGISEMPGPPPERLESSVPPDALAALEAYINTLVTPQCAAGTSPDLSDGVLVPEGNGVTVTPGRAACSWATRVNPYCGARLCQVWIYEWDGAAFNLVEDGLR